MSAMCVKATEAYPGRVAAYETILPVETWHINSAGTKNRNAPRSANRAVRVMTISIWGRGRCLLTRHVAGEKPISRHETRHASSWRKQGRIRHPAQASETATAGIGSLRMERSLGVMAAADESKVNRETTADVARPKVQNFIFCNVPVAFERERVRCITSYSFREMLCRWLERYSPCINIVCTPKRFQKSDCRKAQRTP